MSKSSRDFASQAGDAYYDDDAGAWVLSRHRDVLAAFRSPGLLPTGPSGQLPPSPPPVQKGSSMRLATQKALSRRQLGMWYNQLAPRADSLARTLPVVRRVDLIADFARPLCISLAAMVTRIDPAEADRLYRLTEPVSAAAAEPYDPALKRHAAAVTESVRSSFPSGPEPLRESGFVGIAHTLPGLLGSAWFALVESPAEWKRLHRNPGSLRYAVEELMRRAEVPRILFRVAAGELEIGGACLHAGDKVVLNVHAAHRDPEEFPQAERLNVQRRRIRHFVLGAGAHSCVGAALIRMAVLTITRPLIERFSEATLEEHVEIRGGSGFRFPGSLPVQLIRPSQGAERISAAD